MSGRKGHVDAKGRNKGRLPPFVPLLVDTLDTPAWRTMSHGARSLYIAIRRRLSNDARNNGRVFVPRFMTHGAAAAALQAVKPARAETTSGFKGDPGGGATYNSIPPRQRDVLHCVRRGLSNKEIARELDIAEGTVKIHLAALFKALGATNRAHAVALGKQLIG